MQGSLQLYQSEPISLPYFDTDPALEHSLVFVPGLGDTLASCPYMARLATMLRRHRYSLVLPQMSSNLGGWGQCTLEGDAQEIATCIAHLRSTPDKKDGNVVLMGHSTGCQDSIAYLLSRQRAKHPTTWINGAILQAPVSDRDSYEHKKSIASKAERERMSKDLTLATDLHRHNKGAQIMPKDTDAVAVPTKANDVDDDGESSEDNYDIGPGNSDTVLDPAVSAHRHWSLYAKRGDDDFFSSDLNDSEITSDTQMCRSLGRAIKNLQSGASHKTHRPRILALLGEKE